MGEILQMFIFFSCFADKSLAQNEGFVNETPSHQDNVSDFSGKSGYSLTYKLVNYILSNYNYKVRPANSPNDVTFINVSLSLQNVLQLETRNQDILINAAFIMTWNDSHLTWNPKEFDGIESIRIPKDQIWYPDISLINKAHLHDNTERNLFAIVEHDGRVMLQKHSIFKSVCEIDIHWYPFDQQTCFLVFNSWTYDIREIEIIKGETHLFEYRENPEFFLENFFSVREKIQDSCCVYPFSSVTYYIQLQRRTMYSVYFFIIPGTLINFCALLVFFLPAESGEKISLGINCLLAMLVFLMAMLEKIPPVERIPLAGIYYGACMVFLVFDIVCTVFVLNLSWAGKQGLTMPGWLRVVDKIGTKILCISVNEEVQDFWASFKGNAKNKGWEDYNHEKWAESRLNISASDKTPFKDPYEVKVVNAMESVVAYVRTKALQEEIKRTRKLQTMEWRVLSRLVDRVFAISFIVMIVALTYIILTSSPFESKYEYCPPHVGSDCVGMTESEVRETEKYAVQTKRLLT